MQRAGISIALAVGWLGCTTARQAADPMVRAQAAKDLSCPQKKIHLERRLGGFYRAHGCAKAIVYHTACEGLVCQIGRDGESPRTWRDRPEPGSLERAR